MALWILWVYQNELKPCSKGDSAMFSLSRFLKFAAAGAFAALTVSGTPTCADEMAPNLGPVGPWSPHGSGITSANNKSKQSGPLEIVTSDGGGNLATATAGQLGLATAGDVSNLQSQINHLKPITQANRPLPGRELGHGRTMARADAKPQQAGIAGP
jgi:hypothetical protein